MSRVRCGAAVLWVLLGASAGRAQTTLGSAGCTSGGCHAKENTWWSNDKHNKSLDMLYEKEALSGQYAEKMGIKNFASGASSCMKCHGTIVKPGADVEEGVSCESCHGPGSGYKEPHKKSWDAGIAAGMTDLRKLPVRADNCVRCHYVTDQKLLATGHPSGAKFDYASGIRTVSKHWKRAATPDDLAPASFQQAVQKRGPVAKATAPTEKPLDSKPPDKPATTTTAAAQAGDKPSGSKSAGTTTPAAQMPAPTPVPTSGDPTPPDRPAALTPGSILPPSPQRDPAADAATPETGTLGSLDLPPRPVLSDSASVRELLITIQKRLELLYGKVGR